MSEESPFMKMFDWSVTVGVYYDSVEEQWVGTDNSSFSAHMICESTHFLHPLDIAVTGKHNRISTREWFLYDINGLANRVCYVKPPPH